MKQKRTEWVKNEIEKNRMGKKWNRKERNRKNGIEKKVGRTERS